MLPVLLIPALLGILCWLERTIYSRLWDKHLQVTLSFDERPIYEGEDSSLVEVVENRSYLPLPVLQVGFTVSRGLAVEGAEAVTVSDNTNAVDVFSLRFFERIRRTLTVHCLRRGYYPVMRTSLVASDALTLSRFYTNVPQHTQLMVYPRLLSSGAIALPLSSILGEITVQRALYEDIFLLRGIRDYVPTDPMRTINWRASARTGDLKVSLRDHTSGQRVRFFLNLEDPLCSYSEDVLEENIRLTASLALELMGRGVACGLVTNGLDAVTGRQILLQEGTDRGHRRSLLEVLARIDLSKGVSDFASILEMENRTGEEGLTRVLLSSARGTAMLEEAEKMGRAAGEILWMCLLPPDMQAVSAGGHIHLLRLDYAPGAHGYQTGAKAEGSR